MEKQKEQQIERLRKRFGDELSDNILSLFYDNYKYSMNSNVGSELISGILFKMNELIDEITNGKKEKLPELSELKKIASKWNEIVKNSKEERNDDYEREVLDENGAKVLMGRVSKKDAEKVVVMYIRLNRFYYAFMSSIGKKLFKDMENNINEGVESIWGEKVNGELESFNVYKKIMDSWNTKLKNRKKLLAIINKRSK
jgi:hypothetical protein